MTTLAHVRPRNIAPVWRIRALLIVAAIAALMSVSIAAVGQSLSVFTAQEDGDIVFGSKALFPGERVTPAFQVGDASSGVEIDRSSPFAFPADGLVTTTSQWSSAFATDRYVDFELNDSLASGVATSSVVFDFAFASSGSGEACFYFEVRRISTDAILGTAGSRAPRWVRDRDDLDDVLDAGGISCFDHDRERPADPAVRPRVGRRVVGHRPRDDRRLNAVPGIHALPGHVP